MIETKRPPLERNWSCHRKGPRLEFRFIGTLSGIEGARSAQELLRQTRDSGPTDLVFDVREMISFDLFAKSAWRKALKKRSAAIRSLETIGARPLIRMGAAVLGLAIGVRVIHSTESAPPRSKGPARRGL